MADITRSNHREALGARPGEIQSTFDPVSTYLAEEQAPSPLHEDDWEQELELQSGPRKLAKTARSARSLGLSRFKPKFTNRTSSVNAIGYTKVFFSIAIPSILAFGAGAYLATRGTVSPKTLIDAARTEEVSAQVRLLTNSIWSGIETIHARSQALYEGRWLQTQVLGTANLLPDPSILHWAVLAPGENGELQVTDRVRGAGFPRDEDLEESYLHAIAPQLSAASIRENGVSLFRIRRDPNQPEEWLAFAFLATPAAASAERIILALVDPQTALPMIKAVHGSLRSFLIGSDGRVIAHSQKGFSFSDFSQASIYTDGVKAVLTGTEASTAGSFVGSDGIPEIAAVARLGTLPFAVVVERAEVAHGSSGAWFSFKFFIDILLGIAALVSVLGFVGIWSWLFKNSLGPSETGQSARGAAAAATDRAEANQPSLLAQSAAPTQTTISAADRLAASLGASAGVQEIKLESAGTPLLLARQMPPTFQAQAAQVVEAMTKLESETNLATEKRNQAEHEAKLLVSRFEADAPLLRTSAQIASKTATVAAELLSRPTLIFCYHPVIRAAILQSVAGFTDRPAPQGMSFPIDPEMGASLEKLAKEGALDSLTIERLFRSYGPLSRLLLARLGSVHFKVWGINRQSVQAGASLSPAQVVRNSFYGVIVVLDDVKRNPEIFAIAETEYLPRVLRTAGLLYENSLRPNA